MAQFPFQNAILKLESKKKERAQPARSLFLALPPGQMRKRDADASPPLELAALRQQITELVAQNALEMVQQAIDAVREEGQYQAMKYLFEMIGLYPAAAQAEAQGQDSLSEILLARLGLPEGTDSAKISEHER
jgi:hypothetical protein